MRRRASLILLCIVGLAVIGCATTFRSGPREPDEALVIALCSLSHQDGKSLWVKSVNLVVENTATGRRTRLPIMFRAQKLVGGIVTDGEYRITQLEITAESKKKMTFVEPLVFQVETGCVSNLGRLEMQTMDKGRARVSAQPAFPEVRQTFAEEYADSLWLTCEWENLRL